MGDRDGRQSFYDKMLLSYKAGSLPESSEGQEWLESYNHKSILSMANNAG